MSLNKTLLSASISLLTLPVLAQTGGLDQAEAIGKFLNGSLPPEQPRPSTGSWTLTNAFPNLTFIDPVEMQPVPFSNRLMVVEKAGRLVVFEQDENVTSKTVLIDIRSQVESSHDSGMMGLAFHPEFGQAASPNKDFLYIYYRYTPQKSERNKAYCRLSRFTWDANTNAIAPSSEFVLINQYDRHNWHNGGGIFFGNDGFLYVSVGDEGGANDTYGSGQKRNLGLLAGVLRIDVDNDPSRSHAIRRQPRNPATPPSGWPNTYSQGYSIPNDNPWPSPDGSQLEEFYAIGLRSPHRMTIDRPTGRIYLGDVGQGSREEISNVVRGANLQWPYREGNRTGPKAKPNPLTGFDQPPLLDYTRTVGTCVIGGFVYRGALHPELQGKYIFGDHGSSRIWSLEETGSGPVTTQLLTLTRHGPGPKRGMSAFGVDAAGEIYVMSLAGTDLDGGRIYRLDKTSGGIPEPPALLSQTTAFSDLWTLTPSPGVIPYEVIQPLWSDGADKKRWIAIPNDGTPDTASETVGWSEQGHWNFPNGTVLIKHFEFPHRRLETRFFVKGDDGDWFGFTYRWRTDGSDAELLPGPAVDEAIPLPDGGSQTWHFPGRNECSTCHTDEANTVLGVKSRHLNSSITYPLTGRTANQIVTLNRLGFFSPSVNEANLSNILTSKNQDDTSATLERRARSYLDINCSQCHQPAAPTQAAFDARLDTAPWFQDIVGVVPGNNLGIPGGRLVKPGDVARSIVHARVGSLTRGIAMPPLAKNIVDSGGLQLLTDWINSLDPETSPTGPSSGASPTDHTAPTLTLSLPGGPNVTRAFSANLTASEVIEGLTASDVAVSNGEVTDVSGSGQNWTISITPQTEGAGSIQITSDKVTDIVGNANPATANLPFTFQIPVDPDNLLSNSGFESDLTAWDSGGTVSVSSNTNTGLKAATVGESSFLVQTIPVDALTQYLYRGRYFTTGSALSIEAGLTFWDANGVWINDEIIPLADRSNYGDFEIEFTAPVSASTVSVWILTGAGGQITVDDLLIRTGGAGNAPSGPYTGPNRLPNGGFDSGTAPWDLGNNASLTTGSASGSHAVELGGESFFVQTLSATPGENIALSGKYRSSGTSPLREIGFSFWKADGSWITDRTIQVTPSTNWEDFLVYTTVPENSATLTVWGWNGQGTGSFFVDELSLTSESDQQENIFENGDFENGTTSSWDTGGTNVTTTTDALSGNHSAALGVDSFVVHNQAAAAGDEYTFSGIYRTSLNGFFEAGFTLWGDNGVLLDYGAEILPASATTSSFEIIETMPPGTVAISVWFFSGDSGTATIDNLSLRKTGSAPAETLSTTTGSDVTLAAKGTSVILKNRDGLQTGDLEMDAGNLPTQPDLLVGEKRGKLLGERIFNRNGKRQTAKTKYRGKMKFRLEWVNRANEIRDSAMLRAKKGNRHFKVRYYRLQPSRSNITSSVIRGTFETPEQSPDLSSRYEMRIKQKRSSRKKRFKSSVRATSILNPRRSDVVRMTGRRKR